VSYRWILSVALLLVVWNAVAQAPTRGFPQPPQSMDPENHGQPKTQSTPTPGRHPDMSQAEREADDLSRMAQTIPADVAKVKEGMLPKDVIEKLKQIEKLSKRLRNDIVP
jgi:hypothetical protein